MEKNNIITLTIEDVTDEGAGIGKIDGLIVFVEGAVPGDKAECRVTKVKKNYALAEAIDILEKSPMRKEEGICPNVEKCGGCSLGLLEYDAQLKLKAQRVKDNITRIGGVENPLVREITASPKTRNYRNKATISVYGDFVGFKEKKSHRVVDCESCFIQNEKANYVAAAVRDFLRAPQNQGVIDSIVVKTTTKDEVMVVINKTLDKKTKRPVRRELSWEELALNIDDATGNTLESIYVDNKLIAGKHTVTDTASGLEFEISKDSFYQVNHDQMINMYEKVLEYAEAKEGDTILDLYCGIGTIGLFAAKKLQDKCKVIGIEAVKDAVIDANRNAVINYIVNARYLYDKAEKVLPEILGQKPCMRYNEVNELVEKEPEIKIDSADVVILDPPRAGCDKELLDSVLNSKAKRIVYVSCNPGTLARDIKYLTDKSSREGFSNLTDEYEFIEATPFDMFPETGSIESVCLLIKK